MTGFHPTAATSSPKNLALRGYGNAVEALHLRVRLRELDGCLRVAHRHVDGGCRLALRPCKWKLWRRHLRLGLCCRPAFCSFCRCQLASFGFLDIGLAISFISFRSEQLDLGKCQSLGSCEYELRMLTCFQKGLL